MNRDKTEITALILRACSEPLTRSKIMYNTILNFHQVKNYVVVLVADGLLKEQPENKTFVTTHKGRRYLELYSQLRSAEQPIAVPLTPAEGDVHHTTL
jgi:predicted transcriptional regulator